MVHCHSSQESYNVRANVNLGIPIKNALKLTGVLISFLDLCLRCNIYNSEGPASSTGQM